MIYTPYVWPNLFAFVIPIGFALYMRRFRDVPAARSFGLLMWLVSLWALFHVLNISTVALPLRLLWMQLQVVPFVLISPAILALALEYIGQGQWLTRKHLLILLIIPVITILLAWTANYHTLFRYNFHMDLSGPVPVLLYSKGVWHWAIAAYSYALILVACGLLVTAFRVQTPYFGNALIIVFGILLPFSVDLLYNLGITPIRGQNLVSTTFVIAGALTIWAILRFRMFDVTPIACHIVMEAIDDPVIVLDAQNHIVDFNRAAQAACGLSPRLIGATPDKLPPEWGNALRRYTDCLAHKEEVTLGSSAKRRTYDLTVSPIQDERRRAVVGRLFLWHDITEHKRVLETLRRNAAQLATQNAELDAFAHTVAHGLKNPVAVTISLAQLLLNDHATLSPADLSGVLGEISRNGQKLDAIIDELMLLASVRKQIVTPVPLDMGSIVRQSIRRLHVLIKDRQAQITLPAEAVWPVALGYAPWIEEVWTNYIGNAVKYGGAPPLVRVGADLTSFRNSAGLAMARFWVRDNGSGLHTEDQVNLFASFSRLDQVRADGHGLGLSIVRRIVEKLGGQVGVKSDFGHGSVFFFTLPLAGAPGTPMRRE
jgi:PAS domain S-box-containing protein